MISPKWWLLSLFAPLSALAQASLHRIETIPADPAPGSAFQIKVTGTWPDTCAPEVMPTFVSGNTIDVSIRAQAEQICGSAITPYSVIVDPTGASGFGQSTNGVYRVRFSVKDSANQPTLLAFRLIDLSPTTGRGVQPESGFWTPDSAGEFRTSGSGIGFMVERQGETLAMTTNAYTLGGQAAWYLSAGELGRASFRADLLRSIGGQPLWGTYRGAQSVEPAGSVDIEFSSDASAVVWYARPSGEGILDPLELMPISVRRMNFALASDGQALDGVWTLTGTDPNSARKPDTFRLVYRTHRVVEDEAVLDDPTTGYQLRCGIDLERRDAAPVLCSLSKSGAEVARLDNNALARLSGRDGDGLPVLMLRVGD